MIMGPRPTLGWLGYLMIGGSWYRIALLIVAVSLISLLIVEEGQKVVTLRHVSPAPFPPPTIFVHNPEDQYLTPLDACSVEAATTGIYKPKEKRRIYVYLWKNTVTPADVWANWVLQMPMVHLTYMDLPQLVSRTEIEMLKKASRMEAWKKWLAARVGLLWIAGGVVMPFGSIMMKPLSVETVGPPHAGLLLEGEDGLLDPLVLGTPSHHPIISRIAKYLLNNTQDVNGVTMNSPEQLLTKAVKEGCDIDKLLYLPESDCSMFTMFTKDKMISLEEHQDIFESEPEGTVLLRYLEEPYNYLDDDRYRRLFQINQLNRFCPDTARYLELRLQTTDRL